MAVKESPKESLKALIVNTSDTEGGAARAAFRLHQGLHQRRLSGSGATKVDAQMLVQAKQSDDRNVLGTSAASGLGRAATGLKLTLDQLPLKRYPQHDGTKFSSQWIPDRVTRTVKQINPDVINLHWINNGYLKIETLARWQKPIVWTLHDMWPFTGGCHYDQNCDRYTQSCGACPQLGSSNNRDLSSRIWNRKQKTFQKAFHTQPLTVVAPSQWLADCARKSTLFQDYRVECIP
ncbi:MAG: glycosyltransferase, partial [Cyanobacteria bacterium J06576_12]